MSTSFSLRNPDRAIQVGVILMNSTTEILDVAPVDLLYGMSTPYIHEVPGPLLPDHLKKHALACEFHWVSENGQAPSSLTSGVSLIPTDSFATCPPLDIVLMGAAGGSYQPTPGELAFIRKAYQDCSAFLSICGGSLQPLQAGLLQGKTAAALRPLVDAMRRQAPETNWVERRWARDGKMWTSGALLNGLDMMVAFARDTWGGEDGFVEHMLELGGWPKRSVEYKDGE